MVVVVVQTVMYDDVSLSICASHSHAPNYGWQCHLWSKTPGVPATPVPRPEMKRGSAPQRVDDLPLHGPTQPGHQPSRHEEQQPSRQEIRNCGTATVWTHRSAPVVAAQTGTVTKALQELHL